MARADALNHLSKTTPPLFALIIGAGFGGLAAVAKLRQLGISDFLLVERANSVGGVWQANRYPGAACDVPSHLYSFSFAPSSHWTRKYGGQAEIESYLQDLAARWLQPAQLQLGTRVVSAHWDDSALLWQVRAADGRQWRARVLIPACGQLSEALFPAIVGLDNFSGTSFHSAHWPADDGLDGQHVAVVGSGASAIQFLPAILARVASITLFQRSPPYVLPKPDRAYRPSEQAHFRRWPWLQRLGRMLQYSHHEARGLVLLHSRLLLQGYRWAFLRRLNREVSDPELRRKLIPTDPLGCKRILLSNDWYRALTDPKVTVVDQPIAHVSSDGVVNTTGQLHRVDSLILGTGFRASRFLDGIDIRGSKGCSLRESWQAGPSALLGMTVAGFPNLTMLYGPNTNLGHNSLVYMLECQTRYLGQAWRLLRDQPGHALDLREARQHRYQRWLEQALAKSIWAGGCRSWYQDDAGRITTNWPASTLRYWWQTRRFRPEDFELIGGRGEARLASDTDGS